MSSNVVFYLLVGALIVVALVFVKSLFPAQNKSGHKPAAHDHECDHHDHGECGHDHHHHEAHDKHHHHDGNCGCH